MPKGSALNTPCVLWRAVMSCGFPAPPLADLDRPSIRRSGVSASALDSRVPRSCNHQLQLLRRALLLEGVVELADLDEPLVAVVQ